jgi:hypothetical protein
MLNGFEQGRDVVPMVIARRTGCGAVKDGLGRAEIRFAGEQVPWGNAAAQMVS